MRIEGELRGASSVGIAMIKFEVWQVISSVEMLLLSGRKSKAFYGFLRFPPG